MIKSITIDCDPGDIPEGYTNKAEFKCARSDDYILDNGRIIRFKSFNSNEEWCLIPASKQIDWQKMIGKPVEYLQDDEWVLGKLKAYSEGGKFPFVIEGKGKTFSKARPAHNILFGHNGGECPLPKGFEVSVFYRDGEDDMGECSDFVWEHTKAEDDIISYEIIGISEGYAI